MHKRDRKEIYQNTYNCGGRVIFFILKSSLFTGNAGSRVL